MVKCEKCGLYLTQSEIDRRKCDNCNRELENNSLVDTVIDVAITVAVNSLFDDSSSSSNDTSSSDSSFDGFGGGDFGGGGADSSW